ncbi:MAG: hypothetical protein SGPRY_008253 [Prymnesium sp.]
MEGWASCRPSFFVIGAPKAGSTSLFHWLSSHPRVHPPALKELCFFSSFKRHLQRGKRSTASSWHLYTAGFAGKQSLREARLRASGVPSPPSLHSLAASERAACSQGFTFEACPFYLGELSAPPRLLSSVPGARVVCVLRNPWARTISAYHDYVRHGRIERTERGAEEMELFLSHKERASPP